MIIRRCEIILYKSKLNCLLEYKDYPTTAELRTQQELRELQQCLSSKPCLWLKAKDSQKLWSEQKIWLSLTLRLVSRNGSGVLSSKSKKRVISSMKRDHLNNCKTSYLVNSVHQHLHCYFLLNISKESYFIYLLEAWYLCLFWFFFLYMNVSLSELLPLEKGSEPYILLM